MSVGDVSPVSPVLPAATSSGVATADAALGSLALDTAVPFAPAFRRASQAAESPPVCHIASAITATITAATPHSHERRRPALFSGTDTRARGNPPPADAGNERFCSSGPLARRIACVKGAGSAPSIFA